MENIKLKFPNVEKKQNRGQFVPNFIERYKKLIAIWKRQKLVEDCLPPVTPTTPASHTAIDSGDVIISNAMLEASLKCTDDLRRSRRTRDKPKIRKSHVPKLDLLECGIFSIPFQVSVLYLQYCCVYFSIYCFPHYSAAQLLSVEFDLKSLLYRLIFSSKCFSFSFFP